ncbi:hypothetical protein GOP47_0006690 [Adiantum capillus-veneris]|uniref:Uncharacterized protein n=1 Tax=Adiantum capillus-veneris TaxID=13818 RepID=A0A9D4V3C9_ADICA|nr:hypothetical protein GOP47_0006690 [Adiantum capillus-veneris]
MIQFHNPNVSAAKPLHTHTREERNIDRKTQSMQQRGTIRIHIQTQKRGQREKGGAGGREREREQEGRYNTTLLQDKNCSACIPYVDSPRERTHRGRILMRLKQDLHAIRTLTSASESSPSLGAEFGEISCALSSFL